MGSGHRVAAHCRHEDRHNRAFAAAVVLVSRLDAADRPNAVTALTGGLIRDGHLLAETARASYWRALLAGYAWYDAVVAALGSDWWTSAADCSALATLRAEEYGTVFA